MHNKMVKGIVFSGANTLHGIVLYCILPLAAVYLINVLFLSGTTPKGVPLIQERTGKRSFSLKTRFKYLTSCESLFREAYHNVRFTK